MAMVSPSTPVVVLPELPLPQELVEAGIQTLLLRSDLPPTSRINRLPYLRLRGRPFIHIDFDHNSMKEIIYK